MSYRLIAKRLCARLTISLLVAAVVLVMGCEKSRRDPALVRAALNKQNDLVKGDIHLGVVWNSGNGGFVEGALLAAEEINRDGGIEGRKLSLSIYDERPFLSAAHAELAQAQGRYRNAIQYAASQLAKTVVSDPILSAVIGHTGNSQTALPAMLTYSENGVLFFSGGTTDSKAKWASSGLYLQMLPHDQVLADRIVAAIEAQTWNKVYLVYEANRHNEYLAELIKKELADRSIEMAGSSAILQNIGSERVSWKALDKSLGELREGGIDAIILLGRAEMSAKVIEQARTFGIVQPFIGTGELDTNDFIEAVGQAGVDTIVTGFYRDEGYLARKFAQKFEARFEGLKADSWAALGYDSVKLYAEAVACAGSTQAEVVSRAVQYKLPLWYGLVGPYAFKDFENVRMQYYTRTLQENASGELRFRTLATDD